MKLSQAPWSCSTKAVSKASADAVNEHFVAAVNSLVTKSACTASAIQPGYDTLHENKFDFSSIMPYTICIYPPQLALIAYLLVCLTILRAVCVVC